MGTRQSTATKIENIADRAAGYGMTGLIVDGNDVFRVYESACEAVERARKGKDQHSSSAKPTGIRDIRGLTLPSTGVKKKLQNG